MLLSAIFSNSASSVVCEGLIIYTLIESTDLPVELVSGSNGYVKSTLSVSKGAEYKSGQHGTLPVSISLTVEAEVKLAGVDQRSKQTATI